MIHQYSQVSWVQFWVKYSANNDGVIAVTKYTKVTVNYTDADSSTVAGAVNVPLSASTYAESVATSVETTDDSSDGGGGFDALDNVSLIAMILGFLGIGAFIARRKLANKA